MILDFVVWTSKWSPDEDYVNNEEIINLVYVSKAAKMMQMMVSGHHCHWQTVITHWLPQWLKHNRKW